MVAWRSKAQGCVQNLRTGTRLLCKRGSDNTKKDLHGVWMRATLLLRRGRDNTSSDLSVLRQWWTSTRKVAI